MDFGGLVEVIVVMLEVVDAGHDKTVNVGKRTIKSAYIGDLGGSSIGSVVEVAIVDV